MKSRTDELPPPSPAALAHGMDLAADPAMWHRLVRTANPDGYVGSSREIPARPGETLYRAVRRFRERTGNGATLAIETVPGVVVVSFPDPRTKWGTGCG